MASFIKLNIVLMLIVTLSTVGFAAYCDLQFKDCGSVKGKLTRIQINETCKDNHAELKKASVVNINFTFTPNEDVTELTSKVYGVIAGIPVPFPLKNPNACNGQGLKCPVKAGSLSHFHPNLEVKSSYPAIGVTVKWELEDKDGNNVFCAELLAQISS